MRELVFSLIYLILGMAMWLFQEFIWLFTILFVILLWVDHVQDSNDYRG